MGGTGLEPASVTDIGGFVAISGDLGARKASGAQSASPLDLPLEVVAQLARTQAGVVGEQLELGRAGARLQTPQVRRARRPSSSPCLSHSEAKVLGQSSP
jgi:hypothetical protein